MFTSSSEIEVSIIADDCDADLQNPWMRECYRSKENTIMVRLS
jgi:hypothetical protein